MYIPVSLCTHFVDAKYSIYSWLDTIFVECEDVYTWVESGLAEKYTDLFHGVE